MKLFILIFVCILLGSCSASVQVSSKESTTSQQGLVGKVIGCSHETNFEHGHITLLKDNGSILVLNLLDNQNPPCDTWKASDRWELDAGDYTGAIVNGAKIVIDHSLFAK